MTGERKYRIGVLGSGKGSNFVAIADAMNNLGGSGRDVKMVSRTDAKHGELKWIVETNGAIRAWNEKNAIEISLTPVLQGGKVSWNCRGYPITAMPAACGGKS